MPRHGLALALPFVLIPAALSAGEGPADPGSIRIERAAGAIHIDGDLTDEGWRHAARVDTWYETAPGDNSPPPVKSTAYLAYDERFLFIGLDFQDPNPKGIRAPLGDHDDVDGNSTDFGGIFIDALDTGRTAVEFFVSPSNVQYDAVTDDASGENSSPDFFWDSATRITSSGWTAELRIPFSTLRYKRADPRQWGIILFRNYPRTFRYQITSVPLPRGSTCTVCHEQQMTGLTQLPSGGHIVLAPYASGSHTARAVDDVPGAPLTARDSTADAGLDVKYNPNADSAIDLTVNPDFSQIESDTAQISANERFALFVPEKRPFFLEGVDLLQTPIQAVYTRTITAPDWGTRITGKSAGIRYTALVARDAGGGLVILPGPLESSAAPQDFASTVFVARAKRDIGRSFVGVLVTDREATGIDAHNRVAGPDFEWRPSGSDAVQGQWLWSQTRTPDRPDVAPEWTGQSLSGSAFQTNWTHGTRHLDWFGHYTTVDRGFRADTGFVPQVGYWQADGSTGWSVHPKGPISRQRTFLNVFYQAEPGGALITRQVQPGFGMDTRFNGFVQLRYSDNRTRAGAAFVEAHQFGYTVRFSPNRIFRMVLLDQTLGQDVDFDNARPATGATTTFQATVQPTDHLAIDFIQNERTLHVVTPATSGRLFVERISRVKGTYTFTSRMFVRAIGQYVHTDRQPQLYLATVDPRSAAFGGSVLFAYKVNWQSVLFAGYGDDRLLSTGGTLAPLDRQLFVKLSYAFQR